MVEYAMPEVFSRTKATSVTVNVDVVGMVGVYPVVSETVVVVGGDGEGYQVMVCLGSTMVEVTVEVSVVAGVAWYDVLVMRFESV